MTDPVTIIQVLSPSTMDYQTERRVEVIRRPSAGETEDDWVMEVIAGDEQIEMPALSFSMPLKAVYHSAEPALA